MIRGGRLTCLETSLYDTWNDSENWTVKNICISRLARLLSDLLKKRVAVIEISDGWCFIVSNTKPDVQDNSKVKRFASVIA